MIMIAELSIGIFMTRERRDMRITVSCQTSQNIGAASAAPAAPLPTHI